MRSPFRPWFAVFPLALTFAGPARALPPARIETLANGLTVLLDEDHSRPLVAICTHVDGGSRTERDAEKGLSHYYEHTIFRGGTATQAELETRKAFRELGDFGGYTTDDHTTYYMVVPRARLDEAFPRYSDALLGLQVTAEKIEKDRQSVVQEYAMRVSDSPSGLSWTRLFQTAFDRHPYRLTPIGSLDIISTARLEAFKTFYEERYVPNHMVIAVSGDFEPEDMLRRIRESFGARPAGKLSFELGVSEPPQSGWREDSMRTRSELVYGTLGFKVPALAHPDFSALRVLDALLLSGRSSRLWRALKEKAPLAVDLWSDPNPRADPSLWVFGFSARPEDESALVHTLLAELGAIAAEGVTADELERARSLLERDLAFETETNLARAVRLADYAVKRALPLEARVVEDVRAVSLADVQRVARRYLSWNAATLFLVRPEGASATSYRERAQSLLAAPAGPIAGRPAPSAAQLRTLEGGVRLITRPERETGVVAVVAAIPGGQWLEGPQSWGASALLARSLMRGTVDLDETALGAALDSLGARVAAESAEDLTTVTLTVPARALSRSLPIFLDVIFRPRLEPAALERSRKEALAEIRAIADDSFADTTVEFRRRLFGALPYAHPAVGEVASVSKLDAVQLRELHQRAYVPANVVLAASGDFDPVELATSLEAGLKMATAGRSGHPAPSVGVTAEVAATRKLRVDLPRDHAQATWEMGRLVPGIRDPQSIALRVAARALGSRLFFRWVYEEGVAYRMWTRYSPLLGPSPFWFEMGVDPVNLGRTLAGVEREVLTASREGFSQSEITSARESLVHSLLLEQQTVARRAAADARNEALGLGVGFAEELPEKLRAVTLEQANAAIAIAADPAKSVRVVLGPLPHAVVPGLTRADD